MLITSHLLEYAIIDDPPMFKVKVAARRLKKIRRVGRQGNRQAHPRVVMTASKDGARRAGGGYIAGHDGGHFLSTVTLQL